MPPSPLAGQAQTVLGPIAGEAMGVTLPHSGGLARRPLREFTDLTRPSDLLTKLEVAVYQRT
jgi:predicted metal-dependent phosphotriesterase family hydrolase